MVRTNSVRCTLTRLFSVARALSILPCLRDTLLCTFYRSVQRNRPVLTWKDAETCSQTVWSMLCCSTPQKYKLTSSYLEVKRTTCGRTTREVVDLGEIEDVHEEVWEPLCVLQLAALSLRRERWA